MARNLKKEGINIAKEYFVRYVTKWSSTARNANTHMVTVPLLYSLGISDAAVDGRYIAYPANGPWHSATDTAGEIRTPLGGSFKEFSMERSPGRNFVLWRQSLMCVCLCVYIYLFPSLPPVTKCLYHCWYLSILLN